MHRTVAAAYASGVVRSCRYLPATCIAVPWRVSKKLGCSLRPSCHQASSLRIARGAPNCVPLDRLHPLPYLQNSPSSHKPALWEYLPVTIFKRVEKDCLCPVTADAADIYLANVPSGPHLERQQESCGGAVMLGYDDVVDVERPDIILNLGCNAEYCSDSLSATSNPSDVDCRGMMSSEKIPITVIKRSSHLDEVPDTGCVFTSSAVHGDFHAAKSCQNFSLQQVRHSSAQPESRGKGDRSSLPSHEMLHIIQEDMAKQLPRFFVAQHHYENYHHDVTLENNYYGKLKISRGIIPYTFELNKMKMLFRIRYAYVRMNVLKITSHPEDGTVRIRWRISAVPHLAALKFWQTPSAYYKGTEDASRWFDGFSVLHVSKQGKIYRHRVERVIPDDEQDKVASAPLAAAVPT